MGRPLDLIDIIHDVLPHRPAGQPQSSESIDRDQRLAARAESIAKLRALRLDKQIPVAQKKPRSKGHLKARGS
jgi:hypothetical protein